MINIDNKQIWVKVSNRTYELIVEKSVIEKRSISFIAGQVLEVTFNSDKNIGVENGGKENKEN